MAVLQSATAIKNRVRDRDGSKCVDCGMTNDDHRDKYNEQLHVHRLRPGSRYYVRGCVSLCRRCHWNRHKGKLAPRRLRWYRLGKQAPQRVSVQVNMTIELAYAIHTLAADNRRRINAEVAIALEAHLAKFGMWPPETK